MAPLKFGLGPIQKREILIFLGGFANNQRLTVILADSDRVGIWIRIVESQKNGLVFELSQDVAIGHHPTVYQECCTCRDPLAAVLHDKLGVDDISFDAFVQDLETVVDAAGVERFPLLGISQGCAVSIAYAVRHPERVSRLILYGGFARGGQMRGSQDEIEQSQAMRTLIRHGWASENPAFRQMFTSRFIPDATAEQTQWFNDLQRMTTSPENAARLLEAFGLIEVSDLLPKVAVPTLILHCRNDVAAPFEEGRRMAAMIPGARFVALEGRNHFMLEDEPAWPRFLSEVRKFLAI